MIFSSGLFSLTIVVVCEGVGFLGTLRHRELSYHEDNDQNLFHNSDRVAKRLKDSGMVREYA